MSVKLIFFIVTLFSLGLAGNYLDNYFCTNEICNQYWIDCPTTSTITAQLNYCKAKQDFLDCVKIINLNQSPDAKNQQYNVCRAAVTYDNGNDYFYFLNCQINCGYQSLWIECGQQLNDIGSCPGSKCQYNSTYSQWNNDYQICTAVEDTNLCAYVADSLVSDCQNSVKAKCKSKVSSQVGKSNEYVNLMYCESQSQVLIFSIFALLNFFFLLF